ncbi:hypothetical protein N7513_007164, partial [Penicillium frequentans]
LLSYIKIKRLYNIFTLFYIDYNKSAFYRNSTKGYLYAINIILILDILFFLVLNNSLILLGISIIIAKGD